jgi:hypothetical protein
MNAAPQINDLASESLTSQGWVYFVQALDGDGHIKIGTAKDVAARIADLQVATPFRLELIGKVEGGRALEQKLHRKLEKFCVGGEWFKPNRDVRNEIQGLLGHDIRALRSPESEALAIMALELAIDGGQSRPREGRRDFQAGERVEQLAKILLDALKEAGLRVEWNTRTRK